MPRFKSIISYQNIPKIKLFLQKMQNFQALGGLPPDPQNNPPIANFWLPACISHSGNIFKVLIVLRTS